MNNSLHSDKLKQSLETHLASKFDDLEIFAPDRADLMATITKAVRIILNENSLTNHQLLGSAEDKSLSNKLSIILEYERAYLELIKQYQEEIKFAQRLQEDLRRERTYFFTHILREVITVFKTENIEQSMASKWIDKLVDSYVKSLDLSAELVNTNVVDSWEKLNLKYQDYFRTMANDVEYKT